MVMKGGIAKITDFGIARLPNSAVKTMTGAHPRLAALHVARAGDRQDDRRRSDTFSLGVVLYEGAHGRGAFDGDNVNAIMYATVNTTPVPPSHPQPQRSRRMLDLIVADGHDGRRLLDGPLPVVKELADGPAARSAARWIRAPAAALKATTRPAMPRNPAFEPSATSTAATMP
jgi:serine/threonine-protein kinase